MNRPTWTIREANQADADSLAHLYRMVVGVERPVGHVNWKFEKNPDRIPLTVVADHGGRIVGQYALWATPLRIGSEKVLAAQSLDTMTHPEYRGQGMFVTLAESCMALAKDRGVQVLYGFPNENSYPGFVRRLDWDHVGDVELWTRPLAPSNHGRMPRILGPISDTAASLLPMGSVGHFEIRTEIPSALEIDALLGHWREQKGLCRIERTAARLLWRFDQASGYNYQWVAVYTKNQLNAFAVWGVEPRRGNAQLCELRGISRQAMQAAVTFTMRAAKKKKCPLILALTNEPELRAIFRRCSFFRTHRVPLIVRKLTTRTLGANVHSYENWRIQASDCDTF